jgi:hypothetical protein
MLKCKAVVGMYEDWTMIIQRQQNTQYISDQLKGWKRHNDFAHASAPAAAFVDV